MNDLHRNPVIPAVSKHLSHIQKHLIFLLSQSLIQILCREAAAKFLQVLRMNGCGHILIELAVGFLVPKLQHQARFYIDKVQRIPGQIQTDNHRVGIGYSSHQGKAFLKLLPLRCLLCQLFVRDIMKSGNQYRISVFIQGPLHDSGCPEKSIIQCNHTHFKDVLSAAVRCVLKQLYQIFIVLLVYHIPEAFSLHCFIGRALLTAEQSQPLLVHKQEVVWGFHGHQGDSFRHRIVQTAYVNGLIL